MKELDQFSVEKLERYISQFSEDGMCDITDDEIMPLISIVLAAKTAQTVAYTDRQELAFFNGMACMWTKGMGINEVPLYAAPALNSPAIPDGWILLAEQKPEVGEEVIIGASDGSLNVATWCGDHFDDGNFFDHIRWPTHWKPAPTPPTTEK